MAYADLATVQTIATGEVITAALLDQARDNDEFLIDPPACSITESTAQSVANNTIATATALTADEENFDNDSMHSTTTNTSRITIQTAGRYWCSATVLFAINGTGFRYIGFRVNGTDQYDGFMESNPGGSHTTRLTAIRAIVLAAGDYVECVVAQNSGGNLNVTLDEFAAFFMTR